MNKEQRVKEEEEKRKELAKGLALQTKTRVQIESTVRSQVFRES